MARNRKNNDFFYLLWFFSAFILLWLLKLLFVVYKVFINVVVVHSIEKQKHLFCIYVFTTKRWPLKTVFYSFWLKRRFDHCPAEKNLFCLAWRYTIKVSFKQNNNNISKQRQKCSTLQFYIDFDLIHFFSFSKDIQMRRTEKRSNCLFSFAVLFFVLLKCGLLFSWYHVSSFFSYGPYFSWSLFDSIRNYHTNKVGKCKARLFLY